MKVMLQMSIFMSRFSLSILLTKNLWFVQIVLIHQGTIKIQQLPKIKYLLCYKEKKA